MEGCAERREEQDQTTRGRSKVRPPLRSEIRASYAGKPWSQCEKQTAELPSVVFAGIACFKVDLSLRNVF